MVFRDGGATLAQCPPVAKLFIDAHEEFLQWWSLRKGITGVSAHCDQVIARSQTPVHAARGLLDACHICLGHGDSSSISGAAVTGRTGFIYHLTGNGTLLEHVGPDKREDGRSVRPRDRVPNLVLQLVFIELVPFSLDPLIKVILQFKLGTGQVESHGHRGGRVLEQSREGGWQD